jgi:aminocarboxymuconate-semialdehyde decarboxylase
MLGAGADARADARYAPARPLLTIDVHTHIMPESLPDLRARYGCDGWVSLQKLPCGKRARMMRDDGTAFREVEDSLWSLPRRLADCDARGVRVHVLSTVPVLFSYWAPDDAAADFAALLNDHMARAVAHAPNRLVGLGTLPMQSPKLAVAELRRCMGPLGLAGVQIGTHVNDKPLSDAELFPVFEAAAELGAAVFVHPCAVACAGGGARRGRRANLPSAPSLSTRARAQGT